MIYTRWQICHNIVAIHTANNTVLHHVTKSNTWITDAEKIRAAAETKAKEAYDKLKVNKTLSNKIGEIVTANNKIKDVHEKLGKVHGNLGAWKQQAGTVLGGAIQKAQQVHDALQEDKADGQKTELGKEIKKIEDAKTDISKANDTLGTEVTALERWHKAAEEIVSKAQHKCEEIMQRAHKGNGNQTEIEKNANMLKEKATALLGAYSQAYPLVNNLTEKVQNAIGELETGMKQDLENIRNNIVSKMKSHVGEMLKDIKEKVKGIKGTEGTKGKDDKWTNGTGILGISSAVHNYATEFSEGWSFKRIVGGWAEGILGSNENHNKKEPKKWLEKYVDEKGGNGKEAVNLLNGTIRGFSWSKKIIEQIKTKLHSEIEAGRTQVQQTDGQITQTITSVKNACEAFVSGLDEKLASDGIQKLADQIFEGIAKGPRWKHAGGKYRLQNEIKLVTQAALIGLSATASQVGKELNSVLLGDGTGGINIASELDKAKKATEELHENLGEAQAATRNPPASPSQGTNKILEKVNEIEEQVKMAMKQKGNDIEVEETMTSYKEKREKPANDKDGLYKKLTEQDIPQAMEPFTTEAKLKDPKEVSSQKQAVNSALEKITQELQVIAYHVNKDNKWPDGQQKPQPEDPLGIKQHLKKLQDALDKNGLDGAAEKGLEAIKTAIGRLQSGEFTTQPAAIGTAVKAIKAQLRELRKKLKNKSGKPEDGVINVLEDLQKVGLEQNTWTPINGKGQKVSGLGKIQEDLKEQNEILPGQTKVINDAILEIRGELARIGIALKHDYITDDLTDELTWLGKTIGKNNPRDGTVQRIHDEIKKLQKEQFTNKPRVIDEANSAIKAELTALQGELQGNPGSDVIATLKDLKNTGLSGNSWIKDPNKKGLAKIHTDLSTQQNTLEQQPGKIGGGVTQITNELNSLRGTLYTEVTEKLQKLKNHGLNDGNTPWTIEGKTLNGIQKTTADIEAIKTENVKDVKDCLRALCAAIRPLCRELKYMLNYMKDNMIGNWLKKIRDDLGQLQSNLLSGPIQEAQHFLKKTVGYADTAGRQIIRDLHAFVDKEIKEAEETLIREARRQYLSNIKELLKLFAQKVEEELSPLPPLINGDLQIGYKGLMRQVEGKPETQVAGAQGEFEKFEEFVRTLPSESKERVFKKLAAVFMHFYGEIKAYVHKEIRREHKEEGKKKNPVPQEPETLYTDKLVRVTLSLNALLEYIRTEDTFDHRLHALLRSLTDALSHLRPESFARPSSPVLDGLAEGLTKFAAEFTCAYVSTYAGAQFTADLVENETLTETVRSQGTKSVTVRNVTKLTPYGAMCAKVFLTTLPTLCDAFTRLAEQCGKGGKWRDLSINSSSELGTFLQRSGYKVSTSPFDQDGELRDECNGRDVYVLVTQNIKETHDNEHLKKCLSLTHACNLLQLLKCLCTHLTEYYRTCHLKVHPSPRPPCSIYEMLTWCCGLTYNAVYLGLNSEALPSLFEAPDRKDSADSGVSLTDLGSLALKAHPQSITPASLTDALTEVCHKSHTVLTTLLGFGHAGGIYAVDFNTNPGGLLYPGDADDLMCLFYDVLKRLHHQLHFLYRRCLYNTRHGGWLDCWYGQGVGGSSWKCNTMQCANQMCDQQCNQTHNQICNQRCDQHPKCGVKSPLQSFLEDGLVGFLPHAVTPMDTCVRCPGCDTTSPGLPCKTPMGLSNITRLASRASQGRSIMDVLGAFCGGASSPLTRLCSSLTCLFTRPPRTPDELFAFFYQFICDWRSSGEHRKAAFEDAVGAASFWQRGVTLDVSTIFGTSDHGIATNMPHLTGDLFSLVQCNGTPLSPASHPCGPYLKPLGHDVSAYFAKEHARLYLSWVVYLTETFYDILCSLLQDCERTCADATSTCHARSCADCTAKRLPMAPSSNHTADCPSIVDCDSTTPTLFRYGFVHRDAHSLAGSTSGQQSKRTCEDFCTALQVAVKELNPLHKLAHETIPEYLYRIRAPFLFTLFTLWLTATFYILHSLLYRMDVLRLRSHLLTTRASHLIDVKALLAGSRRMLSLYKDVDYFDDDFHS
ncbi:hypothetical protein, conserved [Babesia ovata]|uniref:Extracellular matrix-binding ebh n=1 Tax=Babesia ovata TaxID=189622 RepID=A0A2H6KIS6_9APIC|nr:uncharacterized protein BOVATA_043810 [Babesia ovata]GBE62888.1 hypothetical protein, conserved [Babesia ovata]